MERANTTRGFLVGVVTSLDDPDKLGRVQVRLPHLGEDMQLGWAKLASPMAGAERGMVFRPEPEDEVLVGFEYDDPRRPYVLGGLWSSVDKPPADDGDTPKNNWRFIRSRSGHLFKFDDTEGGERIELVDKDGQLSLVIDTAGGAIELAQEKTGTSKITFDANSGDITVSAPGHKVRVEARDIEAEASGNVSVKGTQVSVEATGSMTLKAGGQLVIQGALVKIN
jgi:uncharacterized protein involved in type VI secretion and phage assembly